MHVLIIPSERFVPPDEPVAGIFQHHQAHALSRAGIRVGVIAPTPRSLRALRTRTGTRTSGIEVENDAGIRIYRFQGINWPTARVEWLYQWYWNRIAMRLFHQYTQDRGTPDLVHAHNWLTAGVFAAQYLSKQGIPLIVTEHSSAYACRPLSKWQRRTVAEALPASSANLVVSPSLGQTLACLFGRPAGSWHYVPNILDEFFERSELPRPKASSDTSFRFLHIATLVPVKNQANLLRAFALSYRGVPEVTLRIGGDGPLRAELQDLATRLGISPQVVFLGHLARDQVLAEMQRCDAFVLSSDCETFGVVLIEAAACGKPLIATAGSGPDSIVHARNGLLVPPGDAAALAQAMKKLQHEIAGYDPAAIRADCIVRFGTEAVAEQLISVYRSVLSSRRGRTAIEQRASLLRT